ncbi:hypothetical protein [Streptomyces xanthophaeus]|uniref:hypothetical protein n=1 Tax=Streptomyces xanthophaeus TaxID=67385 RepID=UPI003720371F
MSDYLTDAEVRGIIRPLRDGGPISRLYATGEIQEDLIPALGVAAGLEEDDEQTERIMDVIQYAHHAGDRPPVRGWTP